MKELSYFDTNGERTAAHDIAFVVPARNEEATVGRVASVCLEAAEMLSSTGNVTVVSDGSTDLTAAVAREEGASVIELVGEPSKSRALVAGVSATESEYLFFVDGDCLGLTAAHLARMAEPVVSGEVVMSVGTFDYRYVRALVRRYTWSSGERVLPRALFPSEDDRLNGYNIEIILNERAAATGGRVASWNLDGVSQRTKREKLGAIAGTTATLQMWGAISRTVPQIDLELYRDYMRSVELWPSRPEPSRRVVSDVGFHALRSLSTAARFVR